MLSMGLTLTFEDFRKVIELPMVTNITPLYVAVINTQLPLLVFTSTLNLTKRQHDNNKLATVCT